jgi:hypothetical protein
MGRGRYPGVVAKLDKGAVVTLGTTSTFLASRDGAQVGAARIQLQPKLAEYGKIGAG